MQYDIDGNGKLDAEEMKLMKETKQSIIDRNRRGDRTNDLYPNIFRAADRNPGEPQGFQAGTAYDNKIDMASDKILYDGYDYYIDREDIDAVLKNGDILSNDMKKFKPGTFNIRKHLQVVAANIVKKVGNEYYMKSWLRYPTGETDEEGNETYAPVNKKKYNPDTKKEEDSNGLGVVWVRIKERDANYGEQQKKDKRVNSGT